MFPCVERVSTTIDYEYMGSSIFESFHAAHSIWCCNAKDAMTKEYSQQPSRGHLRAYGIWNQLYQRTRTKKYGGTNWSNRCVDFKYNPIGFPRRHFSLYLVAEIACTNLLVTITTYGSSVLPRYWCKLEQYCNNYILLGLLTVTSKRGTYCTKLKGTAT